MPSAFYDQVQAQKRAKFAAMETISRWRHPIEFRRRQRQDRDTALFIQFVQSMRANR